MPTEVHNKCFRAIRSLRFNRIQNPEVVLDKKLQTIGLNSNYLEKDPGLFEIFQKQLYRRLSKRYYRLQDLIDPAQFICQIKIMRYMLEGKPKNEQTYEPMKTAITIPPFRKRLIPRKTVEKPVIKSRSKKLKDINPTSNLPKGLRKGSRTLKALVMLPKIRFTWKKAL